MAPVSPDDAGGATHSVVVCARWECVKDGARLLGAIRQAGYECRQVEDPEGLRDLEVDAPHLIVLLHLGSYISSLSSGDPSQYSAMYRKLILGDYAPLRVSRSATGRATDLIELHKPREAPLIGLWDYVTAHADEEVDSVLRSIARVIELWRTPLTMKREGNWIV